MNSSTFTDEFELSLIALFENRPCQPSPCGPNSECRETNGQAVCSCASTFIGTPPFCRPECTVSSECALNRACIQQKCVDPCNDICGVNARCNVINHSPFCSCNAGLTGDPFVRCFELPGNIFKNEFKKF